MDVTAERRGADLVTHESAAAALDRITATVENSGLQDLQTAAEKEDNNHVKGEADGEYVVSDSDDDAPEPPQSPPGSASASSRVTT